uniref:Papilin n=1 Tax=Cacopsylla melanoneura TaxID=428564 RepID=A0A8D9BTP0_9HEMI
MTEESCQARCTAGGTAVVVPTAPPQPSYSGVDVCDQPKDVGPCDGNYEQWYYDRDYDRCLSFQYGGCQGNHNRFNDQWSCQERCVKNIPPPDPALTPSTSLAPPQEVARHDLCFLEANPGPCSQQEAAWYFDRNSYRCQSFIYGGCEGNANRFNTEEQCERQCGEFRAADSCNVPVDAGPCKGNFPKFYFDSVTGSCVEFGYGGCQGSANRFSTVQECESVCLRQEEILPVGTNLTEAQSAICRLPAAYGSCTENHKRFYYDERRGTCIAFGYSGCGGNLNRFTSAAECLQYCAPQTQNEVDPSPSPSPQPEDPCASATAECRSVFNCQYGVERWLNQHGCERCRCNDPCANDHPGCPSDSRCAVDPVRNPDSRDTQYIAVCRPLNKEGECRPQPLNVCADNCHDDADCTGQAKCCPNECGMACSTLIDSTTTTTSTQTPYPLYSPTQYAPDTPSPPQFYNESEPNVEAEEGNFVTLRCIAIGFPVPVYTWSKGEVRIDGSDGHFKLTMDGILQIVGLVRQDAGIYVCMAANGVGNPLRKEFNVVVKLPVKVNVTLPQLQFGVGADISIPCDVDGHPVPQVFWYKDGGIIENDGVRYRITESNRLHIYHANATDSGEYRCYASNPYSSDSGSVSIQVEGIYIHPHCVDKPLFANCHLIVSGHLCNHKYYGGFCCESCTRAGQLPSRGPHLKRATEEDSGPSRSKRSLVSRLFDW